jgi:MmyB-like transcription regulator ligand binding domain
VGSAPANAARFIFLDARAREFYPDWNKAANDSVVVPRASAGRDPYDRCLSDLVGELSTQSDEFRTRWAHHNVRQHITGIKHFHHPVVGDLTLTYDRLELVADPGLTMYTYTARARLTRRRDPAAPRHRASPVSPAGDPSSWQS